MVSLRSKLAVNWRLRNCLGYNIIHIVPNEALANEAFNFTEFERFLDIMDEIELWLMYDMSK